MSMSTREATITIKADCEYGNVYWKYEAEVDVQEDGVITDITIITAQSLDAEGTIVPLDAFAEEQIEFDIAQRVESMIDRIDFNKSDED